MSTATADPPRVLLVGTFLSGAYNRSVGEDLADRLTRDGWAVVMTSRARHRLPRVYDMLKTVWRRRGDFDVAQVDVYGGKAFVWAELVTWLLRRIHKPYLLTLHGGALPALADRWPSRVRRVLASAATVTTPSGYLYERMAPFSPRLMMLPNPVDATAFSFRSRKRLRPRLVWIRSFHRTYRPELAPAVLAAVRATYPEATLVMVGPDKDGSRLRTEARARDLGVAEAIEFVGGVPHEDIPGWLDRGDIFLNTTDVDNTPVSLLEAMAAGLVVVSTNVGGIPYLVDDGVDGLLVPPGDPDAMAAAVVRVLGDPALAGRLTAAGRAKVEGMAWSAMLPRWQTLLREVASEGRRGAR